MLTMFQCEKTYCKLVVRLYVDVKMKEASGTISYEGRILRQFAPVDLRFGDVDTPEKANAWLSRPMGERGSLVEMLEWQARHGLIRPILPEAA